MRFSAEWWAFWAGISAVALTAAAALMGLISWYFNTQVNSARDRTAAEFRLKSETDMTALGATAADSNRKAAEALSNLAEANARAAEARQKAAEANKLTESFRLDIAQANERAAAANETAEKERLARLQLETRLADRVITGSQLTRLRAAFSKIKGQTVDLVIFGDTMEVATVAGEILKAMQDAGVLVNQFAPLGGAARGVMVGVQPDATSSAKEVASVMVATLRETLGPGVATLTLEKMQIPGAGMTADAPGGLPMGQGALRIFIGGK
jgi:hypothetical protein